MSNYIIVRQDELNHYGVKGMKWGVRKERPSMGGRLHRLAAANYNLNAKAWGKLGNNTLASMNRAAANQSMKKATASDAKKAAKIQAKSGSNVAKKMGFKNSNYIGKAVGKSYKENESIERKKASVATKLGAKGHAQKYKNNADYFNKTGKDLASGKVGKPRTNYQKAMRFLGKTNFATKAILANNTPGVKLTKQQQAQALAEQHQMRKADGWYKKRAKTVGAVKVAKLAVSVASKRG